MTLVIAIFVILLSLLAWLGQVVSAIAARAGLTEKETEVDSTFYVDVRAECIWDALILWVLPAATVLQISDGPGWPLL